MSRWRTGRIKLKILQRMMVDQAVYWSPQPAANNNKFGQKIYNPPIDIWVKWLDKAEMFLSKTGEQQISKATIYYDGDDLFNITGLYEMQELGVLCKGTVAGLQNAALPFQNPGAWEIRGVDKKTTLNGIQAVRKAFLG